MSGPRISLPIEVFPSRDAFGGYHAKIVGADVHEHSYRSESDARRKLAARTLARLVEADEAERNDRRTLIACGDGTILLVEFRGGWGYRIASADRARSCGVSVGVDSESEARAYAREHARQCYGGVAWELAL